MRSAALLLACIALVCALLAVLTMARYEALRQQVSDSCPGAAALDLTAWIPLCKAVGWQQ